MRTDPDIAGGKLSILILEDKPDVAQQLQAALHQTYDVICAQTIAGAMKQLDSSIDVIICGVHLRHESMFDFLKKIREIDDCHHIPFVCFRTGNSEVAKFADRDLTCLSLLLGANAYIALPNENECNPASIYSHIEQALQAFFKADAPRELERRL